MTKTYHVNAATGQDYFSGSESAPFKTINKAGVTILLIEHDMKLVAGICEKLTVLNFGAVLTQGETNKVLSDPEVIKAYLGSGYEQMAGGNK